MNTPDGIITLTPALQWGFAGFALILLGVFIAGPLGIIR